MSRKPHHANTHAYADDVVEAVLDLALRNERQRYSVIGLSGLQGSGKSTLAKQVIALAQSRGVPALTMSIDDFYLGRAARKQLARDVHPLLITRGVPGTHDVSLVNFTLDALRDASPKKPARIPHFDKGTDTRLPPSRWRHVKHPPRFVILEGWCIGVPPQSNTELIRPINELERTQDADGTWRHWVNDQLRRNYVPLWKRFDELAILQAPSFDVVLKWRDEQERALRARHAARAQTTAQLKTFLQHYERLSRQALKKLPALADLRLVLDTKRGVHRIVVR
ncbi:MAG TPA: kinase [Rudaea sp.]|nr:kinase [Rudaea sp.]